MLGQSNATTEIAAFPSPRASFTLPTQADPLPFTDAARNLYLILLHLVRTGSPQRHGPRRAMQCFLECDHDVRLYIGAPFGCRTATTEPAECGATAPAPKK